MKIKMREREKMKGKKWHNEKRVGPHQLAKVKHEAKLNPTSHLTTTTCQHPLSI